MNLAILFIQATGAVHSEVAFIRLMVLLPRVIAVGGGGQETKILEIRYERSIRSEPEQG